jgi:hypothetical protein
MSGRSWPDEVHPCSLLPVEAEVEACTTRRLEAEESQGEQWAEAYRSFQLLAFSIVVKSRRF